MNRKSIENIIVPEKLTIANLGHEFSSDKYEIDQTSFLCCNTKFDFWFYKYKQFIENIIEPERMKYTTEKSNYLRKFFDKQTAYKEYKFVDYKCYRQQDNEKKKAYREENKDKIKQREKAYREKTKQAISERKKQYRKNNREKCLEYQKKYREEITIKCPCGGRYVDIESSKLRHFQTKLHKKYTECTITI